MLSYNRVANPTGLSCSLQDFRQNLNLQAVDPNLQDGKNKEDKKKIYNTNKLFIDHYFTNTLF